MLGLRSLEKEIFISQVEQATKITKSVKDVQKKLMNMDFQRSIDISDQAANLFYYDEKYKERILLEFDEVDQLFIGKNGAVTIYCG